MPKDARPLKARLPRDEECHPEGPLNEMLPLVWGFGAPAWGFELSTTLTTTTTTEKVDGLRSLHKQSSTLKSAKHSAKSSLAQALSHTRSVEVQVTAARLYQGSVPEVLHLDTLP